MLSSKYILSEEMLPYETRFMNKRGTRIESARTTTIVLL